MLRIVVPLFVLGLLLAVPARAQSPSVPDLDRSRYSPAAYYHYAEPGDVTVLVNVWGTVRHPGRYEVPTGTTMETLLSLAGGPLVREQTNRSRRKLLLNLVRPDAGSIFEAEMEDELVTPDAEIVLQTGDVLVVDTVVRERFSWRDLIPIVNAVGVITLAIERITAN